MVLKLKQVLFPTEDCFVISLAQTQETAQPQVRLYYLVTVRTYSLWKGVFGVLISDSDYSVTAHNRDHWYRFSAKLNLDHTKHVANNYCGLCNVCV